MDVLELDMSDAAWLDPTTLRRCLKQTAKVRMTWEEAELYRANSRTELALNWLKTWYVAETLAKHAVKAECDFREGERNAGIIVLELTISDPEAFAAQVVEFAPVFDPDEIEAPALIFDEAEDWLEKRGDQSPRFPELERCYRDEADEAKESEGDRSESNEREDEEG